MMTGSNLLGAGAGGLDKEGLEGLEDMGDIPQHEKERFMKMLEE